MAQDELSRVTQDAVQKGGVLAKVYFDMQSEKEGDLQPIMTDLISDKLLKMPGVIYCAGEIAEPIKVENHFSTNAVATILTKDLSALINICFHYTPLGIEILKPERELVLKVPELQSILLDLANVSTQYNEYILSRVLSKEDFEKVKADLENRELQGKKLLEKK